jgi:hypothetical protein
LSTAQLNAECDLKYSDYQWMYDPQEGTLLPLGNHCLRVDLCYFRDGDIHFLSKSVQITVIPNKFTPPPPLVSVLPFPTSPSLSPSSRSHNGNQPVQTSPSSIGNIARRIFNWSPKNKTSPTAAENWYDTHIYIVYLLSYFHLTYIHYIIFLTIYIHTYISIYYNFSYLHSSIHPCIHACT